MPTPWDGKNLWNGKRIRHARQHCGDQKQRRPAVDRFAATQPETQPQIQRRFRSSSMPRCTNVNVVIPKIIGFSFSTKRRRMIWLTEKRLFIRSRRNF